MKAADGRAVNDFAQEGTPNFVAVTPSDSTVLTGVRALYIGGAGNLYVKDNGGTTVAFMGVLAGTVLPISPSKVMSTSTTATNIVALK